MVDAEAINVRVAQALLHGVLQDTPGGGSGVGLERSSPIITRALNPPNTEDTHEKRAVAGLERMTATALPLPTVRGSGKCQLSARLIPSQAHRAYEHIPNVRRPFLSSLINIRFFLLNLDSSSRPPDPPSFRAPTDLRSVLRQLVVG